MTKISVLLCGLMLYGHTGAWAQRVCGAEVVKQSIIARHPEAAEKIEQQRKSLQSIANQYKQQAPSAAAKTTATASPIPVIFHVIVNASQLAELGGVDGVARRCDSQIAVLNRDYNRANGDSSLIPASFKPFYSSVGIRFGRAGTTPTGAASSGYEIKIISDDGFNGSATTYTKAKHNATNGLDAWDVHKYLNVWCINFLDYPGLIGLTVAPSFVDSGWNLADDIGVCLTYNVFGARASSTDNYPNHFDEGRSLTHEIGHFFEIWHTWGDDGGLCPGNPNGVDDGLADTPPEANNASGSPTGPVYDACSPSSTSGIMWMNYMDYCNDDAVHMFTIDQAAVMAAQVAPGGESYTLTQHPELSLGATDLREVPLNLNIFPNPATNTINITFNNAKDRLMSVDVLNIMGQHMLSTNTANEQKDIYSIDLSGMSKGIYFVRCNFASGSITSKIVLQ